MAYGKMGEESVDLQGLPRPLSAKFKCDFAYPTVKDRLPVILSKAVDTVYRMRDEASQEFGEEGLEDLKTIVGQFSKLRNEVQTDKPLAALTDGLSDELLWNKYLEKDGQIQAPNNPSWFTSAWLYTECYFYRRITSSVLSSVKLKHLDPFGKQKRDGLNKSLDAVLALAQHLKPVITMHGSHNNLDQVKDVCLEFLQVCLWGNKCDLSISAGAENAQTLNPVKQLDELRPFIVCNEIDQVWHHIEQMKQMKPSSGRLDLVLDNAGFELFSDLCFAELALSLGLVKEVHFHAKCIPWFVSDVTREDFDWTLNEFVSSRDEVLRSYGNKWKARLDDGSWVFKLHDYWTLPHDFSAMKTVAPDLHADLAQSDFILFKGDLNYRKLTGDFAWPSATPFDTTLRGFHPAPLCALRTLKSDLVAGLREGVAKEISETEPDWMLPGKYAIIQFSGKKQ